MASNSQSKRPSKDSKETSKKDASSGLAEQPPAIVDPDVILHQVPGVVYDHVIDHQILTETFKKEDVALKRLSDLQKSSVQANPQHLVYKPNPYNKKNHQFVTGKVLTAENPEGPEDPNKEFLQDTRRIHSKPIDKQDLPLTSNQEIGWFTKVQPFDTFRRDQRVNHSRRYSGLTRYMDTYWSYYPPPPAKFHPKDN